MRLLNDKAQLTTGRVVKFLFFCFKIFNWEFGCDMTFKSNLNLIGIAVYIIWDLIVGPSFLASCEFEFSLLTSARFSAIQVHSLRLKNMMINESKKHTH